MALVMLRNTNNPGFKYLEGRIGELQIFDNGRFKFTFTDKDGSEKHLSSDVKGRLGDLDDFRSKEVNIMTGRSTYDFTKLENYIEETKLFDHSYREGIGEKIDAAEKHQASINRETTGNETIHREDFLR